MVLKGVMVSARTMKKTLLILAALFGILPATAGAQFSYTTNDNMIVITGCSDPGLAVVIPDMIDGLAVTAVADGVFSNRKLLRSLTIGTNVVSIGPRAFQGCKATVYHMAGTRGWGKTFGGRPTAFWPMPGQ